MPFPGYECATLERFGFMNEGLSPLASGSHLGKAAGH